MKNWQNTKGEILDAPLPENTESYSVIPHRVFLEEIVEVIHSKGYEVVDERYLTANNSKIITGVYRISSNIDNEIFPAIAFTNSYNKTRKAEIRACAQVLVCKNGMMGSVDNGYFARVHTGNALSEFRTHITTVVNSLEKEFERLVKNKEEMKQILLEKTTVSSLLGDMLINEKIINPTQLGIIIDQITQNKDFTGNSLWSFYNWITEALKDSHPAYFDKQQVKTHTYISDKFGLTGSRGLYKSGYQVIQPNDIKHKIIEI